LWIVEMLRSMSAEGMLDLSKATASLTRSELPDSLREVIVRRVSYLSESTVGMGPWKLAPPSDETQTGLG
jgi:hypothetical protein